MSMQIEVFSPLIDRVRNDFRSRGWDAGIRYGEREDDLRGAA